MKTAEHITLAKPEAALPSSTRSCGRLGPAMEGTTVARSSASVSVKTGSSALGVQNMSCALAYFSTSATWAAGRAVPFR